MNSESDVEKFQADTQSLQPDVKQPLAPVNPSVAAPVVPPVVWLFFLAALHLIGPFLPVRSVGAAISGGILLTGIYIGAVVAFELGIARRKFSIPIALAWFGLSAAVWALFDRGILPFLGRGFREILKNGGALNAAQQFQISAAVTIQDLALLGAATFAGTLLARLIRHANMIGPVGAAIALIDIWGVLFGGIVSQLMTNEATKPLADKAMAAGPTLGGASAKQTGFSIALPAIGVGDFLFMALLLSVLVNLSMNWRTSARLMWVLICGALLAIQFLPFPALPGLLFIGAAAVLPNWKFFKFTRDEQFALLYAGFFVLLLTVGLYFGFRAMLPVSK